MLQTATGLALLALTVGCHLTTGVCDCDQRVVATTGYPPGVVPQGPPGPVAGPPVAPLPQAVPLIPKEPERLPPPKMPAE
jgi:hypothetical protein